jgi:methylase of polypeptide subunit release factors
VNAALAGLRADVAQSDVLARITGDVDLIIANPPYLVDDARRQYRHGGGTHGEGLSARITRESLQRLSQNPQGGTLLLYTGSAIIGANDSFFGSIRVDLNAARVTYRYEELDPDVFSEELATPAYGDAERIAAVFLQARVGPGS